MKNKIIVVMLCLIISTFGLMGCSANKVEFIGNGSVQKNTAGDKIQLFFSLMDSKQTPITSDGKVDIKIINEDETVYSATKEFTEESFGSYSNLYNDDMLLCLIEIPLKDIKEGQSSDGILYYRVYKEDTYEFEEQSLNIYSDLPIAQATLTFNGELPYEVKSLSWDGSVDTKAEINDIQYKTDEYDGRSLTISFSGVKTYDAEGDSNRRFCIFNYRILDSEGIVIDSGTVYTSDIKVGEPFKQEDAYVYDIIPGESYTIELYDEE